MIELNRPDTDASEADLEHNKYGIERIIEALHAHMWPNMILKGFLSKLLFNLDFKIFSKYKYITLVYTIDKIYNVKLIIDFNFIGKSSSTEEQSSDIDEVEEQFENIKLTQDATERLPMENMLGQLRINLLKTMV